MAAGGDSEAGRAAGVPAGDIMGRITQRGDPARWEAGAVMSLGAGDSEPHEFDPVFDLIAKGTGGKEPVKTVAAEFDFGDAACRSSDDRKREPVVARQAF